MNQERNFFDWEDSFELIENVELDVYVNGSLKKSDVCVDKIEVRREQSGLLRFSLFTQDHFAEGLTKGEKKIYNLKIELRIKEPSLCHYNSIVLHDANLGNQKWSYTIGHEQQITAKKITYISNRKKLILKEWYGCKNKLDFYNGFSTSKSTEETITYKDQNRISFQMKSKSGSHSINSFWVKLDDFKFKVSITNDSREDNEYSDYVLEYRDIWGHIPNEETRYDISLFLSFIIGTKLIKFGETYFDSSFISQKEYISPPPIDRSFLYQSAFAFYNDDYRQNDTDVVIKQIPKMLRRYFLLKEKYRLNEVLSAFFARSYLNYNFINYVTYIEMFSNIDIGQTASLVNKKQFQKILKELNQLENIPGEIKDKFRNLNLMGIGKKIRLLLSKSNIDYSRYKDIFSVRGRVVHGADVDIRDMYLSSEKAKELLTILTLKKLHYKGYIRNFTNNDELISIGDMSTIII